MTDTLTPVQVDIIKATVPVVKEHGNAITTLFYQSLLSDVPELRNLFNHANQVRGHQAAALAGALYAYAANIENLAPLTAALERIDQKHASLYIKPAQYDVVGTYLLRAMGEILGDALTPDIHDAWAAAYTQLANLMISREQQLYKESDGWTDWRDFVIAQKVKEAQNITSFYLKPKDGKPLVMYKPGQYISVQTDVPDLKYLQSRQYSLSGQPRDDYYRISVKREQGLAKGQPGASSHPGYVSTILHTEKNVGDTLQVSHPYGEFFLDTDNIVGRPIVLLSAGIGVTPMIAILDTLVSKDYESSISFIHATRNSAVLPFADHQRDLSKAGSNVNFKLFNVNPTDDERQGIDYDFSGRMDLAKLDQDRDLHLDDPSTEYYICGPDSFMQDFSQAFRAYGISDDRIKVELFGTGGLPVD